jgi:hypothetical protein
MQEVGRYFKCHVLRWRETDISHMERVRERWMGKYME